MTIRIGKLQKKDEKKAIQFAIKGMHFDWYLDAKWMQNLYGRYFWQCHLDKHSSDENSIS